MWLQGRDDPRRVKAEGRNGSQLGRETGARRWRSEVETIFVMEKEGSKRMVISQVQEISLDGPSSEGPWLPIGKNSRAS